MMDAAVEGKLAVPGYNVASVTSIEATEIRAELNALRAETMAKIDTIFEKTMVFAKEPFPDAEAKTHYQALKKKLANFPSTAAGWAALRSNMEKEVDEMASMAARKDDAHHEHHEEGEGEGHGHAEKKPSPAMEFEAKYGRNLDLMQERMNKYKLDPEGFLQASIVEKYGKDGLEVWKKSQEFSQQMSVMSEAEKAETEAKFTAFINQA